MIITNLSLIVNLPSMHRWLRMYLLQGEVPGNNHLVKAAVDRRQESDRSQSQEEVDCSQSLEEGATGPGGSETRGK